MTRPRSSWLVLAQLLLAFVSLVLCLEVPALAVDCVDKDGDGYAVCDGCDPGTLACGDCDDQEPLAHPGGQEVCGDGIDNDCDGSVDFGLNDVVTLVLGDKVIKRAGVCPLYDPPDCRLVGDPPEPPHDGCCVTLGVKQCTPDKSGVICVSTTPNRETGEPFGGPITMRVPEGPLGSPTCSDGIDNNCNGRIDSADESCKAPAEICNGYDDNGNGQIDEGFPLGQPCSVGVGSCRRDGTVICSITGGTTCSAASGPPVSEGPPGSPSCSNGKDDDCDGATDLADTDCQQSEICDGIDNNHNGVVDEGFPGLGSKCTSGEGACKVEGVVVCDVDGQRTVCNAIADSGAAKPEGPSGATCNDHIDNDCDGFTDEEDRGCRSADLTVECSLAYLQNGPTGSSCEGWHRIRFRKLGGTDPVKVQAELLALDLQRNVIGSLPVQDGDVAHLRSNVQPGSWKWSSQPNNRSGGPLGNSALAHDMAAPLSVLHVTADDGLNHAEAFCSAVPYAQVLSPKNTIVDGAGDANATKVLIAAPLTNPTTAAVLIDGLDLFKALGIDPLKSFPGSLPGGTVTIHGTTLNVADINVDIAPDISTSSSNTISFVIKGFGCGTHGVSVAAHPAIDRKVSGSCYVDSYKDQGLASIFDINVTAPQPGQIVDTVPTPVKGTVCHGRSIAAISVNGAEIPVGTLAHTAGDASGVGEQFVATIDTTVARTDLFAELAGKNSEVATFDAGSNRVMVSATDDQGHRIYRRRTFASGTDVRSLTSSTGPGSRDLGTVLADIARDGLKGTLSKDGSYIMQSEPLPAALVVGLDKKAMQTYADAACVTLDPKIKASVMWALHNLVQTPPQQFIHFNSGCNPEITTVPSGHCQLNPTFSCRYLIDNADCEGTDIYAGKCLPEPCTLPSGIPGTCGHCEKDHSQTCDNWQFGGDCHVTGLYGACMGVCMGGPSQGQECAQASDCGAASGTPDSEITCAPYVSFLDGDGNETKTVCRVELDDGPAANGTGGTLRFVVEIPHMTTYTRMLGGCSSFWSDKTIDYELKTVVPYPGSYDPTKPMCSGTVEMNHMGPDGASCSIFTPASDCTPIYDPNEAEPHCAADDSEDECNIPSPECPWMGVAEIPEASILGPATPPPPGIKHTPVSVEIVDSRTTSFDCGIGCFIFLPLLVVGIAVALFFGQFWVAGQLLGPLGKVVALLVLSGSFPNLTGTTIVVSPTLDALTAQMAKVGLKEQEFLKSHIQEGDTLDIAKVNSAGILMGHSILLDPTQPDPEVEGSPGYLFTPAPLPIPPVAGTDHIYGLVSDDFLSQKLTAMTRQGQVKSGCSGSLAETTCCASTPSALVGDLFRPSQVEGQPPATSEVCYAKAGSGMDVKDAAFIGTCLGIFAADLDETSASGLCEAFDTVKNTACAGAGDPYACCTGAQAGSCDLIKNTAQGVCHGVRGANCNQIPLDGLVSPERAICNATPPLHVRASDPVLHCARNDVPPRVVLADVSGTPPVESFIRLNDLLTGIVVDRNRDGVADTTLPKTPKCIDDGTTADCNLMAVCLDVDLETTLSLKTINGNPNLAYQIGKPIVEPRPPGAMCEGGVNLRFGYDSGATSSADGSDSIQSSLESRVTTFIPGESFGEVQLGGLVSLVDPRIVAIKTSSDAGRCFENLAVTCTKNADCGTRCIMLQDYVGVTGSYEVPAPIARPGTLPMLKRTGAAGSP